LFVNSVTIKPVSGVARVQWSAKLTPGTRERLGWWIAQHADTEEAIRVLLDLAEGRS
jgi:hypothetical protein